MTVLDQVPLDRINAQAREVRFSRVLLTVIAALLYGVGWITARLFSVLWLGLAWSFTAIKVGWQEGRKAAAAKRN